MSERKDYQTVSGYTHSIGRFPLDKRGITSNCTWRDSLQFVPTEVSAVQWLIVDSTSTGVFRRAHITITHFTHLDFIILQNRLLGELHIKQCTNVTFQARNRYVLSLLNAFIYKILKIVFDKSWGWKLRNIFRI